MELTLPLPTLILALLALWIAWSNYRRSNFVIIRVHDCSCSHPLDLLENQGRAFHFFRILVKNIGIPLHNVSMALVFRDKSGMGTLSYPLEKRSRTKETSDQLAKGMIAEFFLKSYRLSQEDIGFLLNLEDMCKQDARLCVYSDSYWATELRMGSVWDRCKGRWNQFAFWVNLRLRREMGKDTRGIPIVKYYKVLPTFQVLGMHMLRFVGALRRDRAQNV